VPGKLTAFVGLLRSDVFGHFGDNLSMLKEVGIGDPTCLKLAASDGEMCR